MQAFLINYSILTNQAVNSIVGFDLNSVGFNFIGRYFGCWVAIGYCSTVSD